MRFRLLTSLCVTLLLLLQGAVVRAEREDLEYKVKAAFLLNFAKFITWPGSTPPAQNFPLCIVGEDPFGAALNGVEEKQIDGQNIILRRGVPVGESLTQCRMLFVGKSERANLARIFKSIAGKPVITVSDLEGFAESGGMFEFKDQAGRLGFIINNTKARENGMRIGASLLNLALSVL